MNYKFLCRALSKPGRFYDLGAVMASVSIVVLYKSLVPDDTYLVWQVHQEGVSLTTFGKWRGSVWITDGFSGEFPALYNYLSDRIASNISRVFDFPEFYFQVAYYGPFLSGLMVFTNYLCIVSVFRNKATALLGSLLISFATDLAFCDWAYPFFGEQNLPEFKARMHVPFLSMPVGTAQGLGWYLYLPTLTLIYLAYTKKSVWWSMLAGFGLGIMFQTHSLTFLNVATAAFIFIFTKSMVRGVEKREFYFRVQLVGVLLVFGFLSAHALSTPAGFTTKHFVILWGTLLCLSVKDRQDIWRLVILAASALLVASPYILQLMANIDALSLLEQPVDVSLRLSSVLIFYFPFWIAAVWLVIHETREGNIKIEGLWIICIVVATLMMSLGGIWGFVNHQYRMSVNLIFSLSICFAIVFTINPPRFVKVIYLVLGILASATLYRNVMVLAGQGDKVLQLGITRQYYGVVRPSDDEMAFLSALQAGLKGDGKVLLPPEYRYPEGATRNSLLLGVSQLSAFIPDDRYIIWRDLYQKRVELYCFLFPGFPHHDVHHSEFCKERMGIGLDGVGRILVLNDAIKTDVLSLYDIRYAAYWVDSLNFRAFDSFVESYGWEKLFLKDGKGFFDVRQNKVGDRVIFGPGNFKLPSDWETTVAIPASGQYTFIFAGADFARLLESVAVNGSELMIKRVGAKVVSFNVDLTEGNARVILRLRPDKRYLTVKPTPVWFASGIRREKFDKYIKMVSD